MRIRKKIQYTIHKAGNPDFLDFHFSGKHWSLFYPNLNRILEKGIKPCHWVERSEGEIAYTIATDELWETLV